MRNLPVQVTGGSARRGGLVLMMQPEVVTMSYLMRPRDDGQYEVLEMRPVVIGTFSESKHAAAFHALVTGNQPAPPKRIFCDDAPVTVLLCGSDVGETARLSGDGRQSLSDYDWPAPAEEPESGVSPAPSIMGTLDDPEEREDTAPVNPDLRPDPDEPDAAHPSAAGQPEEAPATSPRALLSEAEMKAAIARLDAGEKLQAVAADVGVPWMSLRASYANEMRRRRNSEPVVQDNCRLCAKVFTPSATSPDLCARCARA